MNLDLDSMEIFSRLDLINYVFPLFGYKSYLEIGVNSGECFRRVNCLDKVGVDPVKIYDKLTYEMTSDSFFAMNDRTFDLIFIDGLHLCDQVIKDIINSLQILNPNGMILMHDCLPMNEGAQLRERTENHWNGDVWKAFAYFRQFSFLEMFTINSDNGLGVIRRGKQEPVFLDGDIDYNFYRNNLFSVMNMMPVAPALDRIKHMSER